METNTSGTHETWVKDVISVGKDLVALLRDGALFLLAVLLVIFPSKFNSILVDAGFEEGSIVSFKWKANLVKSDRALKEAQSIIINLQKKNDELVRELAEANTELNNPAVKERNAKLEEENRSIKNTTKQVQNTVSQAIESNSHLVKKALSSSSQISSLQPDHSDYYVGLQTWGVPDAEYNAINDKLLSAGYNLAEYSHPYHKNEPRPSWLASRSTVLYYSTLSIPAAQQLASFMEAVTGQKFAVQQGGGFGVNPSLKEFTLYVHYIKS